MDSDLKKSSPGELAEILLEWLPPILAAVQRSDPHQSLLAVRRLLANLRDVDSALVDQLNERLFGGGGSGGAKAWQQVTRTSMAAPVDRERQSPLVRFGADKGAVPVLPAEIGPIFQKFLAEHRRSEELIKAGLSPRHTILVSGPPGVGKTMLAGWIAGELGWPFAQIEITSAISSYLGKTGQNVKELLDFARSNRVVLLMDEFDALAKRRDDYSDLGELKRVVSVLLKELEEWHGPSIIIAATNHAELLDAAIFRRFQLSVEIPLPDSDGIKEILVQNLGGNLLSGQVLNFAGKILKGRNGSEVKQLALEARRKSLLESVSIDHALLEHLAKWVGKAPARKEFCELAMTFLPSKLNSYSNLAKILGISSKSTINYYLGAKGGKDKNEVSKIKTTGGISNV